MSGSAHRPAASARIRSSCCPPRTATTQSTTGGRPQTPATAGRLPAAVRVPTAAWWSWLKPPCVAGSGRARGVAGGREERDDCRLRRRWSRTAALEAGVCPPIVPSVVVRLSASRRGEGRRAPERRTFLFPYRQRQHPAAVAAPRQPVGQPLGQPFGI